MTRRRRDTPAKLGGETCSAKLSGSRSRRPLKHALDPLRNPADNCHRRKKQRESNSLTSRRCGGQTRQPHGQTFRIYVGTSRTSLRPRGTPAIAESLLRCRKVRRQATPRNLRTAGDEKRKKKASRTLFFFFCL